MSISSADVTAYLNSTYSATSDSEASSELGQNAFLELLITQLEYQDPLDPMDDTEMVSQLAQFSSLETLESIESTVEGLSDYFLEDSALITATNYLGKEVEASGSSISKTDDGASMVTYTLTSDADSLYAYVVTEDGDIVRTVDLGGRDAGEYTFTWDGEDDDGAEADNGSYAIAFTAADADGDSLYVSTMVAGTVIQAYTQDGETYLGLEDDRIVNLLNVTKIVDSNAASAAAADESDGSDGEDQDS